MIGIVILMQQALMHFSSKIHMSTLLTERPTLSLSLSLSHSSFLHFICDINRGAVADDAAAAATDNLRRDHFQPKKLVLLSTSHRLARFMSKAAAA